MDVQQNVYIQTYAQNLLNDLNHQCRSSPKIKYRSRVLFQEAQVNKEQSATTYYSGKDLGNWTVGRKKRMINLCYFMTDLFRTVYLKRG